MIHKKRHLCWSSFDHMIKEMGILQIPHHLIHGLEWKEFDEYISLLFTNYTSLQKISPYFNFHMGKCEEDNMEFKNIKICQKVSFSDRK